MGTPLNRQKNVNREAQAREEAASKKEAAFKKSANDRIDKLALANNGKHAKDAAYLGKIIQNRKLDKARAEQIKKASDQQLLKFAESHRKNQKDAKKMNEQGRLSKMKESWDKMTPASAAKGASETVKGAARGAQGGLNYVSKKAPDALVASIVVPNLLMAAGGPVALIVAGAMLLLYGGYKAGNAINHALAKRSSDTASLSNDSDVTEKSFDQAFGETFDEAPEIPIDDPDNAPAPDRSIVDKPDNASSASSSLSSATK